MLVDVTYGSTSPTGGNQVDGFPPVWNINTKTIAKRARLGPRTQMHMAKQKLFEMEISSTSVLGVSIIVLDNVFKIWIELIK